MTAQDWHDAQVIEATTQDGHRRYMTRGYTGDVWWSKDRGHKTWDLSDVRVIADRDGNVAGDRNEHPANCNCGYGGFHEPGNPLCDANRDGNVASDRGACSECGFVPPTHTHAEGCSRSNVAPSQITDERISRVIGALDCVDQTKTASVMVSAVYRVLGVDGSLEAVRARRAALTPNGEQP